MRIGIDTSSLDQTIRGIGYYTQTLLEALKDQEVVSFHGRLKGIPFSGSITSLCRAYRRVDLLHFPQPKILYGRRPQCPFVLTIHDVMPLKFPHFFPKKHAQMMRYFLPRYLKQAAAILCVSETTRQDLRSFFPFVDPLVVPCALLCRKRSLRKKKDPLLLYVGSFEKRKNLEGVLKAYTLLRQQGITHTLCIVGREERHSRLPKTIPRGVVIKGYLSEGEKQDLLERASLLLWPSFYEGFGLPLLEAMASGLPVVTSDRGACPETVGKAAVIVNPDDPGEIARGAMTILENPRLASALMQEGLKRANEFSLDKLRERLLNVYHLLHR